MQDFFTRNLFKHLPAKPDTNTGLLSRYALEVEPPIDLQPPAHLDAPTGQPVSDTPAGLTSAQLSEADLVGRRLVDDFRPIFALLPASARSGLGLARYLEIDRGTATRFVGVYAKQITGLDVFQHFPGLKGLTQILDALETKAAPPAAIVSARSALARFDRLIGELGITQTKLTERIAATRNSPENHDRLILARRRNLYKAAAENLGQSCDTLVHVHVCRPSPGPGELMDRAFLQGAIGYKARPDAPPFVFKAFNVNRRADETEPRRTPNGPTFQSVPAAPPASTPGVSIIKEFSTDPVPVISPRVTDENGIIIVDAERTSQQRGLDLVLAQQVLANWPLPKPSNEPTENMHGVRIDAPAKRLVFDVYFHQQMASQYVPRTAIFRMTPAVLTGTDIPWYDQLPYPPPLEVLSCSPLLQRSRFHARQNELIQLFFDRLGWPLSDFVGYRLEVEYPQYAALYRIIFRSVPLLPAE